ncbi:restriction endonuclease subunit S [Ferrovum myxofaciens]|uniref:restriction endonuclease subunit S n=1 Tax=Ferrovum myxofaciens TaxID=416213 RepID=UPI003EBDF281
MNTPLIDISPDQWAIVHKILQQHVPQHEVWAFGSRAQWTAKEYSDLDLVIITDKPLPLEISASLSEDFSESDLPWKVDIVDWATTSESFRKIIERDKVVVQESKRGRGIASIWKKATLDNVSSEVSYGYTESASGEKVGPHFLRITDIQNGIVNWSSVPYCPITAENHSKYRLQAGDIVIARTGNSTGENFLFRGGKDAVFASYLIRFRIDCQKTDPRFVWYNLRSQDWWDFINNSKTGSAQAGANARILGLFPLNLPPLDEQCAIASVLNSLDDKIDHNRALSTNLEAIARRLFKSWFVDFDPVRAKAAGEKPPGLADDIAALFPDRLVDSEMGEIPEGWVVQSLDGIAEFLNGLALQKFPATDPDDSLPVIKISEMRNGVNAKATALPAMFQRSTSSRTVTSCSHGQAAFLRNSGPGAKEH